MWKTFFFLFFLATSIYLINKRWAVFYSHFQLIQLKRVPNTKYKSFVCKKLFLHLQRYKANVVSSLTVSNKLSANFCQTWTWTKYQIKAFLLSLNTARANLLLSKQTMDGCMNAVKANNIFTQSYSHSTTHSPTTILSKCAQNTAKGTGMIIKFNMRKKEESTFSTTTKAGFFYSQRESFCRAQGNDFRQWPSNTIQRLKHTLKMFKLQRPWNVMHTLHLYFQTWEFFSMLTQILSIHWLPVWCNKLKFKFSELLISLKIFYSPSKPTYLHILYTLHII